ncbi:recombinase family protein [Plantactinospora sp. ZYX-F-223]|uniref:recombinase family protein n=1 Tax=Plantactinospora sp. ZYX-F-223 TaxID=3144103 RepID=UPI0031FC7473
MSRSGSSFCPRCGVRSTFSISITVVHRSVSSDPNRSVASQTLVDQHQRRQAGEPPIRGRLPSGPSTLVSRHTACGRGSYPAGQNRCAYAKTCSSPASHGNSTARTAEVRDDPRTVATYLHRLEPDPAATPHVRWIFEQRLNGRSVASIARELNDMPCPSGADPVRNPHRSGQGWMLTAVGAFLANLRYTDRQVALQRKSATTRELPLRTCGQTRSPSPATPTPSPSIGSRRRYKFHARRNDPHPSRSEHERLSWGLMCPNRYSNLTCGSRRFGDHISVRSDAGCNMCTRSNVKCRPKTIGCQTFPCDARVRGGLHGIAVYGG